MTSPVPAGKFLSLLVCLQALFVSLVTQVLRWGPVICRDGCRLLPSRGASGLGPAGRNIGVSEGKKHREGFFHLGPVVSKFSTLLTRWQQLAVPSFRRAEDETAAGLVVVGGLARIVTRADTGVLLVPSQASTVGKPIGLGGALCDREGSEKGAGCLRRPPGQDQPPLDA